MKIKTTTRALLALMILGTALIAQTRTVADESSRLLARNELNAAVGRSGGEDLGVLEKAWIRAKGKERVLLASRLARGLVQSGRRDAARPVLSELAERTDSLGLWARAQLAPQEKAGGAEDPVTKIVRDLAASSTYNEPARSALRQLEILDELANPYILRELGNLGPFGVKNGVGFMMKHLDDPTVEALVALMSQRAPKPSSQPAPRALSGPHPRVYAAEVARNLNHATGDHATRLATTLLKHFGDTYRREALLVFVLTAGEDADRRNEVMKQIDELMQGDVGARTTAANLLGAARSSGYDGAVDRLMKLAGDGESVARAVVFAFFNGEREEDDEAILALWDRLPESGRRQLVEREVRQTKTHRREILLRGLRFPELRRQIIGKLDGAQGNVPVSILVELIGDSQTRSWTIANILNREVTLPARSYVAVLEASAGTRPLSSGGGASSVFELLVKQHPRVARRQALEMLGKLRHTNDAMMIFKAVAPIATPEFTTEVLELLPSLSGINGRQSRISIYSFGPVLQMVSSCTPKCFPALMELLRKDRRGIPSSLVASARTAITGWFDASLVPQALHAIRKVHHDLTPTLLDLIAREATSDHVDALMSALSAKPALPESGRMGGEVLESTFRLRIVSILSELDGDRARQALKTIALGQGVEATEAWSHLVWSRDLDAKPLLLHALRNEFSHGTFLSLISHPSTASDREVRNAFAEASLKWRDLGRKDEDRFRAWVARLPEGAAIAYGKRALETWARAGSHEDRSRAVLGGLGRFRGDAVIPVLAEGLKHSSVSVRKLALQELAATYSFAAAPFLIEALKDPSLAGVAQSGLESIEGYHKRVAHWEKWLREAKEKGK